MDYSGTKNCNSGHVAQRQFMLKSKEQRRESSFKEKRTNSEVRSKKKEKKKNPLEETTRSLTCSGFLLVEL